MELSQRLSVLNDASRTLHGERRYIVKNIRKHKRICADHVRLRDKIERAIFLLQLLSESRRKAVISTFENTVTAALQEIFNPKYSFKLQYGKRNNVSTTEFMVHTGEYKGYLPIKMTQGNSLMQMIAVVLQVLFVSVLEGDKVAIMDEPLVGVDIEREEKVGAFLRTICDRLKIQLVVVTHKTGIHNNAENKITIGE